MVFNQKKGAPVADYTLANTQLKIVEETKYLSVVLQSNLKFDKHIQFKTRRARQQLGMIKRVLYDAPALAYTALCRPHVGSIYETTATQTRHGAKWRHSIYFQTQRKRKCYRSSRKARCTGARRKISRHNPLLKLLSSEDNHGPLIDSYDEQMTIKTCIPVTRAAERGDPPTIYAKSSVYHNSFCQKLSENSRLTFLSSPNC